MDHTAEDKEHRSVMISMACSILWHLNAFDAFVSGVKIGTAPERA